MEQAMERLRAAERDRYEAIRELKSLGAIRSLGLVAELGERFAADYYGVELAPPSTPGYDLVTEDGRRVQVKTLHATPENLRASMGVMQDPYDVLLAIRLNHDYEPLEAIEVPRPVLEVYYSPGTRTSWTKTLAKDDRVRHIEPDELMTPGAGRQD